MAIIFRIRADCEAPKVCSPVRFASTESLMWAASEDAGKTGSFRSGWASRTTYRREQYSLIFGKLQSNGLVIVISISDYAAMHICVIDDLNHVVCVGFGLENYLIAVSEDGSALRLIQGEVDS